MFNNMIKCKECSNLTDYSQTLCRDCYEKIQIRNDRKIYDIQMEINELKNTQISKWKSEDRILKSAL